MDFIDDIKNYTEKISMLIRHFRFGNKAQLAFLEDLFVLVNDGIPVNRAINMMAQVSTGLTYEVASSISQKIGEGQLLAEGMKEWFSPNVIEIIRIGETGGTLGQAMQSAVKTLSQRGVAMTAFISGISYPLFVFVMACAVVVYLDITVFVQFKQIKPVELWPVSGQYLVAMAQMIKKVWWLFILIIGAVFFILRRILLNYTGEYRPMLDNFPPFSFYRQFTSARMLETLGLLAANGVVFRSAIRIMKHQASPYLASHLSMMEHLLGMGKTNIAEILETGLVSDQELMRLRVMAEVKGFEQGLIRMGVRSAEQATVTLKFVSRIVGGIFLVGDAIIIILIVQGIYLTGMSMGA